MYMLRLLVDRMDVRSPLPNKPSLSFYCQQLLRSLAEAPNVTFSVVSEAGRVPFPRPKATYWPNHTVWGAVLRLLGHIDEAPHHPLRVCVDEVHVGESLFEVDLLSWSTSLLFN